MLLAVLLPIVALAMGTGLALAGGARPKVLAPLRSFALAAVLVAIALHILPEALAEGGAGVLAVFVAGLLAPTMLSRLAVLAQRRTRKADADAHAHAALAGTLGMIGVLLHQFGDGLALGAFSGDAHNGHVHWDVLLGIAAHTVPLAAVLTLTAMAQRGRRAAIVGAVLMAGATVAGIALARLGGPDVGARTAPWIGAAVAGLLVHVLTHDVPSPPRTSVTRTVELMAIMVGLALPLVAGLGGHVEHAAEHADDPGAALAMIGTVAMQVAPIALLGLLLPMLLRRNISRIADRTIGYGHGVMQALRGVAMAPMAMACACSAQPIASNLLRRPGSTTTGVAFAIAAPDVGIATVLLTGVLLGWPAALVRIGGAVVLALVLGVVAGRMVSIRATSTSANRPALPPSLRTALDEHVLHTTPWLVVGVAAAAIAQLAIPDGVAVTSGSLWLDVGITLALAVPSFVCAPAATPMVAVLVAHGLPPGAAIAGLLLGGAITMLRSVRAQLALRRGQLIALAAIAIAIVVGIAAGLDGANLAARAHLPALGWAPNAVALACGAFLVLRALWRFGLAAWLEPLHGHDHQHHQHAEGAPCTVDCHDDTAHDHHGHDHHDHGPTPTTPYVLVTGPRAGKLRPIRRLDR